MSRLPLLVIALLLVSTWAHPASVTLRWQDNSDNENGFRVERGEGPTGAFVGLQTTAPNVSEYVDASVTAGATYRYRVLAFNTGGDSPYSNIATVTVGGGPPPDGTPNGLSIEQSGLLANVSARGVVTAADTTLIPGFVVSLGSVRALVRVVGPTLGVAPFNVPGVCADPQFSIVNNATQAVVASNNDWSGADVTAATASLGIFSLPAGSKDAAVVVTLPPGQYTVVARGVGTATGVALAEVYRLDQ